MNESNPSVDLLAGRAFPELATALKRCLPSILKRWERVVREALPKADELTFAQLRDDVPRVLQQVGNALEVEGPRHVDKLLAVSDAHGAVRYHQSYNLNELLLEYDLLRSIILEEVMNEVRRQLRVEEMVALSAGLDICSRRSVVAFVTKQSIELSAATEAQSKYLSFLSHDLRGGLNGVFLMIEVLKRELVNEARLASTLEDLDGMRRSLLETVATMDRFLHAERFRKGKVQVQPTRVDLRSLLNEVVAHFIYQAHEKGLSLESCVESDCVVTSDRELLSLVFQNLLSNAVKYTKAGKVRLAGSMTGKGTALITVADDGPGISQDKLAELFTPFSRGQTYGQPGVGLGLSIARQAADLLEAKLWAESTLGKGCTFLLELPKELVAKPQLQG